ncbi:MAG: HEAT repeat domain-containing protein [Planctomycetaceae bacterium]|nr:HEAT repeat domain-containing protein [Planctomycetaceae bacterium]
MTMERFCRLRALSAITLAGMILPLVGGCAHPLQIRMNAEKAWTEADVVLRRCAQDSDARTRWMALEALACTEGKSAGPIFLNALSDPSPGVRSAAAMAIGDVEYAPAKSVLQAMAQSKGSNFWETDRRTYCAVIFALYRLGDSSRAQDLAVLLRDKESEVRGSAALIMGRIDHESAVRHLKMQQRDEQDRMVQIQIVESLSLLGDRASLRYLETYSKTPTEFLQVVAVHAMGRVKPASMFKGTLESLLCSDQPVLVRVAAAGALGRQGYFDHSGYELCMNSLREPAAVLRREMKGDYKITEEICDVLRELAATSLGYMGKDGAVDDLFPLMHSTRGPTRVVAAMSVRRLLGQGQTMRPRAASAVWKWW